MSKRVGYRNPREGGWTFSFLFFPETIKVTEKKKGTPSGLTFMRTEVKHFDNFLSFSFIFFFLREENIVCVFFSVFF